MIGLRESRRCLRCTQARVTVQFFFFCETSLPFHFVLPVSKSFPGLCNFLDVQTIFMATPPVYALNVDPPPIKHAIHLSYTRLSLRKYLRCVYFRKQGNIFLCHPRNLHCISAGACASCLLQETRCLFCYATYATNAACQYPRTIISLKLPSTHSRFQELKPNHVQFNIFSRTTGGYVPFFSSNVEWLNEFYSHGSYDVIIGDFCSTLCQVTYWLVVFHGLSNLVGY